MKQAAQTITQAYGLRPSLDNFLNTFAAELGYPAAEQVLASAHKESMNYDWTEFWQYTQLLDPDISAMYHYVPFRRNKRAARHATIQINHNVG